MRHGLQLAVLSSMWLVDPNMEWGNPHNWCIMGLRDPPELTPPWQSPCTAQTAGKCLPLGLCKGTVKESSNSSNWMTTMPGCGTQVPCWHVAKCSRMTEHAYILINNSTLSIEMYKLGKNETFINAGEEMLTISVWVHTRPLVILN